MKRPRSSCSLVLLAGAYYYGDEWKEAGGGGAPCNESSMLQVADDLESQHLLSAVRLWRKSGR